MSKILFITVNYCQADLTLQLLNNLFDMAGLQNVIIAVADNSPGEDDFQKLQEYKSNSGHDSLHLYKSPGNIGYFGAADFVMKQIGFTDEVYQYLIISNNDIEIRDKDFFVKLLAMQNNAAVIAPDIVSTSTGKHQNPYRMNALSKSQQWQYRLLFSGYMVGWLLYHSRVLIQSFNDTGLSSVKPERSAIYSAHGAFMIFTRKFFQHGGIIDHGYFLYGEEESTSAQCRQLKLEILLCPELVVFHNEHATTNYHGFIRKIYKMQQNAYRYIKKHYPGYF